MGDETLCTTLETNNKFYPFHILNRKEKEKVKKKKNTKTLVVGKGWKNIFQLK